MSQTICWVKQLFGGRNNKQDRDSYSQIFETETETKNRKMVGFWDLGDYFLRLETKNETEQVQSQQARLLFTNIRDRDQKMCIFETETRKIVETDTLADPTVGSIYNLDQT